MVKPGTKLSDGLFSLFTDADIISLTECILEVGVRQVHIYVNFVAENEDRGVPSLESNIETQHSFMQANGNEPSSACLNTQSTFDVCVNQIFNENDPLLTQNLGEHEVNIEDCGMNDVNLPDVNENMDICDGKDNATTTLSESSFASESSEEN